MPEFEILWPFGPFIYKSKISDDVLKDLQNVSKITRAENESVGNDLAGNIELQLRGKFNQEQIDRFFIEIKKHTKSYIKTEIDRFNYHAKFTNIESQDVNFTEVDFDLGGNAPWINYQRKNEFNPAHQHSGDISAVVYVDVPDEIAEEINTIPIDTNSRCPGQIEFVYSSHTFKQRIIPKTGEILLFNSSLVHTVYPFKSDVERVSSSFNLYNIRLI